MCTVHSQRAHNAKQPHNPSQTWPRPVPVLFVRVGLSAYRTCLWLNLVTSTCGATFHTGAESLRE